MLRAHGRDAAAKLNDLAVERQRVEAVAHRIVLRPFLHRILAKPNQRVNTE